MHEDTNDLVLRLHREEVERIRNAPLQQPECLALPAADLPEAETNSPVAEEWNLFRKEVSRLLSEGYRGRIALVKVGHPITVWDTLRDAAQAGRLLYGQGPCLVQEILPFLRPLRVGGNRPCPD
jgi:hypothetical protein